MIYTSFNFKRGGEEMGATEVLKWWVGEILWAVVFVIVILVVTPIAIIVFFVGLIVFLVGLVWERERKESL